MLIDATRKRPMPPLALPTREHMEHARELWEELGLPPLTVHVAVARLSSRRLDRDLGDLRASAPPPATGSRPASKRSRASAAA